MSSNRARIAIHCYRFGKHSLDIDSQVVEIQDLTKTLPVHSQSTVTILIMSESKKNDFFNLVFVQSNSK